MRAREYLPTRITTPSPSSFCAPSPRRGRRPVNLWSVFLSASVCLPVARAHARRVWSSCRETQQVCGGGTAVIPEDSSGLVFVFFCVGEVEASRCVNRCGLLLIVVFFLSLSLFKIAQICQFEASVVLRRTQTAFGSLLFTRPLVGWD